MESYSGRMALLGLLQASGAGNTHCADCGVPDPEWASYKLGVFICLNCSGIHRNLSEISRVKSLRLDFWEHDLVEFMKKHGNLCAKAIYEAEVPPFYYVPQSKDCLVLREQWIRAKYERKEFVATSISHEACTSGSREGFLWKRGRDSKQFLPRQFILSASDGVLKYYTKEEIVDWFNAIRAARFHYLRTAFPTAPVSELVPKITRSYFKEGYMEKTGPTHKEIFKKRWFSLDSQERNLIYFKDPLAAFETGRVIIGSKEHGYEVRASLPRGVKGKRWKAGFTIVTPKREFVLTCENDREQKEWMEALNEIISQPMTA
ncbi:PREDICTED: arf-GAP with dual PH domain-containing protein 2 isoform X3 [Gavialis gangeticus]|uniref:arf-GAP with dual PH domain-containing protein 2 isoform X3 n=1 Tax=Gavialis gangeticus TaxID=94835 RepID=UPI00092FD937|nr:PREDICTED: arf-GAP with dual PH domain-containing protein 2 isoform X3 [Gavialis gangeticus]